MSKSIITSLTWVKRGFAKAIPQEYEIDEQKKEKAIKFDKKLKQ
jgi:hypothetical protein